MTNEKPASNIVGPAMLELLGLPAATEKLVITFEGHKPIKVEHTSFIHDAEEGQKLVTIMREYGVAQTPE